MIYPWRKSMKAFPKNLLPNLAMTFLLLLGTQAALAGGPAHKMVIQVSSDDVRTQNLAINNAVNLQNALGMDNVAIEIVAYGPGLGMLTPSSPVSKRVPSLALHDITFSACANTMAKMEEKSGEKVVLVEGVRVVPAGVLRILELQEQGYAYLRP
jgi:hypothetical protein